MQSCAEMRHVRWVSFLYGDRNAAGRIIFSWWRLTDPGTVFVNQADRVQGAIALLINWDVGYKARSSVDPSTGCRLGCGAPFLKESIREVKVGGLNKLIVALLLMAAGHGQAAQLNTQSDAPATASASVCPAQDISFFIQRFSSDEAVQRIYTAFQSAEFPVMPLVQERRDNALVMQLEDVTASTARVNLAKPDTDYLVSYYFKMDDCWRLVRIENQSL